MNYVQMDLKEMLASKLEGDVYVHQCELIVVDHQKIDNHSQVTSTFLNVMEPTPTENDDDLPF